MREHMSDAAFTLKKSAIREFSALAKATPGCIALTLGEPDFLRRSRFARLCRRPFFITRRITLKTAV